MARGAAEVCVTVVRRRHAEVHLVLVLLLRGAESYAMKQVLVLVPVYQYQVCNSRTHGCTYAALLPFCLTTMKCTCATLVPLSFSTRLSLSRGSYTNLAKALRTARAYSLESKGNRSWLFSCQKKGATATCLEPGTKSQRDAVAAGAADGIRRSGCTLSSCLVAASR